jgi:DNA-binding CsgD family transcriptional regulator
MRGSRALALIDLGKVSEALAEMEAIVAQPHPRGTVMFTVQTALSRARVRLGLPEGGVIEEMRAQPAVRRDLMRMVPVAVCDAEAVWLGEERPGTRERLRAAFDRAASRRWAYAELALWLSILGEKVALDDARRQQLPPAHRAHIEGSWGEAAESWRALGCPYEQAIALSNGDEEAKRGALAIFESLGARPAARNLRRAMIASGIRSISIGPRAARRKHAAGLTRRQQQVLELIATGLTNLEIAERLGLALRTAENHVAAVLALLEAPNRGHAAQIARERGLLNTAGSRGESE